MNNNTPAFTKENEELTRKLEELHLEFLDQFTRHKEMVENESVILTSLYLEKLGRLQLELLEKRTEAARLKMKMKLIQAAINRNEQPDLIEIENKIYKRLQNYYAEIAAQSASIDEARKVLSHLISEEDTRKLKEIFRVLCKRLHPDLNPHQTEEEKDLFIKVKAAYDLQRLSDLQNILLYLDDSNREKLILVSRDEKKERINYLANNIAALKDKIAQLEQCFPFNVKELIFNEERILQKQEELRNQIKTFEAEIVKYLNMITIMTDE
jgi:hypothetical protein